VTAPVIALASTKGGVGKTTLALCLAVEFGAAITFDLGLGEDQHPVEVIDADPNATLAMTVKRGGLSDVWPERADADTIQTAIETARRRSRVVLVDLPGAATETTLLAVGMADLVLVPCQPSLFDALEALRTLALVARAGRMAKREIPARVVLTRTPHLRQHVTEHTRAEIGQRGLPLLKAELVERTAFRKLTFDGRPVWENEPRGRLSPAAQNVASLAAEVGGLIWREETVE
jgi:chromosome partitioning protein